MPTQLTHKGWLWLCPIYLSPDEPDCPVEARSAWMKPLFGACEYLERLRIFLTSMLFPEWEPTFMFKVTGRVEQ